MRMRTEDFASAFKGLVKRVVAGERLNEPDAMIAFEAIMSGAASPAQMAAFLVGLAMRGETVDEITAGARVMRAKALHVDAPEGSIDTCGTGGDAKGSVNISTAVAFVVAGCGVPVAKHGNRAASSKSGTADVLEKLGVTLDVAPERVSEAMREAGIGFLMAPRHHAAVKHVAPVRTELGVRTVFNLLGPLANPAGAKRQLIGVYDVRWLTPMAEVLRNLGSERVWVVHGSDGLDELTVTGLSHVAALENGAVETFEVTPEDAGLPLWSLNDLKGGTPEENAKALAAVLDGAQGAYRDIVLLNAAAALIVAGKTQDLKEGAAMAAQSIDSGKARKALDALIAVTGRP